MSEIFKDNIKSWVTIDNEIKDTLHELKILRGQKNKLNEDIIEYIDDNNLSNAIIKISDGRLKFQNTNSATPLTFKFLESCLNDVLGDKEDVPRIVQYIKDKREIKTTMSINRVFDK